MSGWRPRRVPASSQEVCRRFGILDLQEADSMQRLRLASRLANAAPSLMALLQCDAGRACKDELCAIWICCAEKWGRSSRRWWAFLISRGCESSIRRLGSSWCLRASGNSWNAACVRNPRSHLKFPFCRLFVVNSAMLFAASSGPSDRTSIQFAPRARRISGRGRGLFSIWRWEQSDAYQHGSTARSSRTRMTQLRPPTSWSPSTGDVASWKVSVI